MEASRSQLGWAALRSFSSVWEKGVLHLQGVASAGLVAVLAVIIWPGCGVRGPGAEGADAEPDSAPVAACRNGILESGEECDDGPANSDTVPDACRWDCEHPWVPTDLGVAVVVKGATRIYWAHKASVMSLGDSEVPIDVRVCLYAAESDGKTLVPHLGQLAIDLPEVIEPLHYVLADDAYKDNREAVSHFGQQARLIVPVHGRKARADLADQFDGIDRFTPIGVPICDGGRRFEFFGRDIQGERYLWKAPDDDEGRPVCASCPHADLCLKRGQRRHIRVDRQDQPQIDWDHPQHSTRERARYDRRPGVERAIKRLKVDLHGAHLTHRNALRVQAHLDRKLLILHLLLAA
jgi:hypothetical protein